MSQRDRSPEDRFVSATEIASLAHCEQKVVLDRRFGETVTAQQQKARDRGLQEHAAVDRRARQEHNRPDPRPSQGPCFIASCVYGSHDPRTDELRGFRDRVLKRSVRGRAFVAWYYRNSPGVVRRLERNTAATWMVRRGLDAFRFLITPWIGEQHEHPARQPVRPGAPGEFVREPHDSRH